MISQQPSRLRPFRPMPFGRYTLLLPLSTGGMGEIFLARLSGAEGFEKLCVVKKILPHLAREPEFVERFVNEAKTLVKLSHGSIAQVLDLGLHEGAPYLAMEHVDGKDLRKVAARMRELGMPLPLTLVLHVMARVLDALAYVHRKRDDEDRELHLIHRDISPQNILVSYEGEVKVIDFGLAKSTLGAARTNPSMLLGKFLYMSPEQARHQRVDRRSDLYAAGLCLYELIAGRNPFEDCPPGELMAHVADPDIPPLDTIDPLCPREVQEVVMKALAVEPAARFQTAEELRGRLLSCLVEIDPAAGPESVSRFMRETFATEYQQERRLLSSLRESARARPQPTPAEAMTVETAVLSLKELRPGPQPLSFAPTTRAKEAAPPDYGETLPSIVIEDYTSPEAPALLGPGGSPDRTLDESESEPELAQVRSTDVALPAIGSLETQPRVVLDHGEARVVVGEAPEEEPALVEPPPEPSASSDSDVESTRETAVPEELEDEEEPRRAGVSWLIIGVPLLLVLAVAGYIGYDLYQSGALRPGISEATPPKPAAPELQPPAEAEAEQAEPPERPEPSAEEEELELAPLTPPPPEEAPQPKPGKRSRRAGVPSEVAREYREVKGLYERLARVRGPEGLGTLTIRFEDLTRQYGELGADPSELESFRRAARSLKRDLQKRGP